MTFLVVHVGAGNHSPALKDRYTKLLKSALRTKSLIECSSIIEKSNLTNTGYGSALDKFGNASCDCTVLVSESDKTDILSLIGIDDKVTPTLETLHMKTKLDKEFDNNRSLGLLKPSTLQYQFVKDNYGTEEKSSLVLPVAKKLYDSYKDLPTAPQQSVQDTVGVMHFDEHLSLSTSSGGTFLKVPGRVSCAGVYGAGVATAQAGEDRVYCMCTGNGDDIIRMRLAGFVADTLLQCVKTDEWADFLEVMVLSIIDNGRTVQLSGLNDHDERMIYVGVIAVIQQRSRTTLAFCHSTESFYFGFVDSRGDREIVLSALPGKKQRGHFVSGQYKL